jgi:peptidoglycan/xylan/chitin deacetylase (PgdA/CDA1 family)
VRKRIGLAFGLLIAASLPASAETASAPETAVAPAVSETVASPPASEATASPISTEITPPRADTENIAAPAPAPASAVGTAAPPPTAAPPAPSEAKTPPASAQATAACPGNPNALGTSRTITVDPKELPRIGTMQYRNSLPLEDHEVVITFDDGPLPPYTNRILDILAENCVKVDYFLVGTMARAYPDLVRRIYNSGHVIGTHSMHHPLPFTRLGEAGLAVEVDGGIAAVGAAAGDPKAVAPFFRIPGLYRSNTTDDYLAAKSLAVFSADEVADDWHRGITPKQIVAAAMRRIAAKGHRGVLLLHDIHPATVMALPMLLKELKDNGYKIVQAVPPGERPQSVPERAEPRVAGGGWPRVVPANAPATTGSVTAEPAVHVPLPKRKHARHKKAAANKKLASHQPAETADTGFLWPTFVAQ